MAEITVYGADWCSMTKRSLKPLDDLGVDYKYIDVDNDSAASRWVREHNPDGKERKPTIELGEQILIEPSNQELTEALQANGFVRQA